MFRDSQPLKIESRNIEPGVVIQDATNIMGAQVRNACTEAKVLHPFVPSSLGSTCPSEQTKRPQLYKLRRPCGTRRDLGMARQRTCTCSGYNDWYRASLLRRRGSEGYLYEPDHLNLLTLY